MTWNTSCISTCDTHKSNHSLISWGNIQSVFKQQECFHFMFHYSPPERTITSQHISLCYVPTEKWREDRDQRQKVQVEEKKGAEDRLSERISEKAGRQWRWRQEKRASPSWKKKKQSVRLWDEVWSPPLISICLNLCKRPIYWNVNTVGFVLKSYVFILLY